MTQEFAESGEVLKRVSPNRFRERRKKPCVAGKKKQNVSALRS
jgi:hypothetical protein